MVLSLLDKVLQENRDYGSKTDFSFPKNLVKTFPGKLVYAIIKFSVTDESPMSV